MRHRHVVHDGDGQVAAGLVARRVLHADGYLVRQRVVALTLGVVLVLLQRIGVAHLAAADARDDQGAFTRIDGDASGHDARVAVGIHRELMPADGHRRGFPVQRQRDLAARRLLVRMGFAAAGIKTGLVHRGRRIVRSRHADAGRVPVARDVDGDRRLGRVPVPIRDGVREVLRDGLALRDVHTGIQLVAVRPVRIQRQLAILALHRLPQRPAFDGGHRLVGRAIRTEHVVGQDIAAVRRTALSRGFRQAHVIRMCRRHVVHHAHRDGAVDLGAVRIRHRHGQIMGNIVHAGAAMLRGVAAQCVGKLQLARDRIKVRHRQ